MTEPLAPDTYAQFLADLKSRIQAAQLHASLAVNRELVLLYWQIGRDILDRQERESWGAKVIDRLASDLKRAFPDMKGFSPRNLKYMRAFAEAWPDEAFVQAVLAQITWYHNLAILEKLAAAEDRIWYAKATIQHGWSRNVLVHQIEAGRRHRQGKAVANFDRTLPSPQSDLAQDITKDPYNFDFLTLGDDAHERDLERGLLDHLRQFLLELGVGFAFVGSQYRLVSVAAKKGTKMAAKWSPARGAIRSEPFPLLRSVVRNGPEPSRVRRCWERRGEPLTARTVLR